MVRSLKIFSAADRSPSAAATLASTPLRRPALSRRFGPNGFFLGGEADDGLLGVGRQPLLALGVGGKLNQPEIEFGDAVLGARFFAVEIL